MKPSKGTQSSVGVGICPCRCETLAPWWSPLLVSLCTAVVRVMYVMKPSNWWILHPDEVFQSLEVAFSEVKGYGFRTYDYLPQQMNVTTPLDEQEAHKGMYATRSFLYPRVYTVIFYMATTCGFGENLFLVGKVFGALVSACQPLSLYLLCRRMFRCHLVSSICCVFAASSLHFNIYGTHTLVNSFLVPFFFLGISISIPSVQNENPSAQDFSTRRNLIADDSSRGITQNAKTCQKLACIETLPKALQKCMAKAERRYVRMRRWCLIRQIIEALFGGILVGLSTYILTDFALLFLTFYFPLLFVMQTTRSRKLVSLCMTCFGCLCGILTGGLEDLHMYNVWFISPMQWVRLKMLPNLTGYMVGFDGTETFFKLLFCDTPTSFTTAFVIVTYLIVLFKCSVDHKEHLDNTLVVVFALIIHLTIFTTPAQERFLHNTVILEIIILSSAVHLLVTLTADAKVGRRCVAHALLTLIALFVGHTYQSFPGTLDNSVSAFSHMSVSYSGQINDCLDYIGQSRNDVNGVMVDSNLYLTGGYTVLGKDVPMLVLMDNGLHEYDVNATKRLGGQATRLRVIPRFVDYIYPSNTDYIMRKLTIDNKYNYVVSQTKSGRFFNSIFYKKVFQSGNFVVYHRTLTEKQKEVLRRTSVSLSVGNNAATLEYEGSLLFAAGLYELAVERLDRALILDDSSVRLFQILGISNKRLTQFIRAREVEKACIKRHGAKACGKTQPKLLMDSRDLRFENFPFDIVKT